jgi:hypothetical protein
LTGISGNMHAVASRIHAGADAGMSVVDRFLGFGISAMGNGIS